MSTIEAASSATVRRSETKKARNWRAIPIMGGWKAVWDTNRRKHQTKHDVFGLERKIKPSPERARLISRPRMNDVAYNPMKTRIGQT
jgi:hypothetical protein